MLTKCFYPENARYFSDCISYVAIGARSVENQQHRLVSSGIDFPVGMKNPTSGDFSVMLNAIYAAQSSHTFLYRDEEVATYGNPLAHAILRGYVNKHGQSLPNYHYEDMILLENMYLKKGLINPFCNCRRQPRQLSKKVCRTASYRNGSTAQPQHKSVAKKTCARRYD